MIGIRTLFHVHIGIDIEYIYDIRGSSFLGDAHPYL